MVGDAVGRTGRQAVARLLPDLRRELHLDLVIANGENAAAGRGITPAVADEMFRAGVDVITTGNHIWDQKEIIPYLDSRAPILRPLNFPPGVAGRGILQEGAVTVINLQGRVFMANIDCPFRAADQALAESAAELHRHRRHARGGDQREAGHGLVPRRPRQRRASARTRTSAPSTRASCPAARPSSATSA